MRPFRFRATLIVIFAIVVASQAAFGATVSLAPSKDNSLFEESDSLSNGVGEYTFVGRIALGPLRRAAIAFDIAGNVPADATITSVSLSMTMSRTIVGPENVALHRAFSDWGEGTSDASGQEGTGAPATPGDATWAHTFFDSGFWATPGGDFAAGASAVQVVDQNGPYTWGSTSSMVADAQSWLDDPSANYGWIVLGEEGTTLPTAKRFNSKDNIDSATHPVLTVSFTTGDPGPVPTVSEWGMILMTLLLLTAGSILFGQRRAVLAGAGAGVVPGGTMRPPLAIGLFVKSLGAVTGATMIGLATAFAVVGELSAVDVVGALMCAPVLSYLIHLWLLPRKE